MMKRRTSGIKLNTPAKLKSISLFCFVLAFYFFLAFYPLSIFGRESKISPKSIVQKVQKQVFSAEQLKSLGIDLSNPKQALERARELGIPEADIQQAIKKAQQDTLIIQAKIDTVQEAVEVPKAELKQKEEEQKPEQIISFFGKDRWQGLKYYGYDIFRAGKGAVGPLEIGPVDPGYPIGAGDVLRLYVWGEVEFQYELTVDREGNIVIPKVGRVFVSGTRLDRLRDNLRNYLSKFYSGLVKEPPAIFMDITLARLRQNQIYIMGEVDRPGAYSVSSYATAFNAMYAIGGPKLTGSLREIRILREGKVLASIDLYDYLLKGMSTDDLRLQNNDIIFVPLRGLTVAIEGEVLRPGIYELTGKETLRDIISLAGGLNPTAYSFRVQIDRIIPLEERVKAQVERKLIDIDIDAVLKGKETILLANRDLVSVFKISEEIKNYVDLFGEGVTRPGRYELNTTIVFLSDLINEADGVTDDVYLPKANIVRTRENLTKEFIDVNLEAALRKDPTADIKLQRWDKIRIYSRTEMIEESKVYLRGYVKNTGEYPLPDNMTLYDLVFMYAGLQDTLRYKRTFLGRGDIFRLSEDAKTRYIIPFNVENVWNQNPGSNIPLQREDQVVLYNKEVKEIISRTVHLSGAIKKPGTYSWAENMTLGDLILQGGGFTEEAYIFDAEIARIPPEGIKGDTLSYIIKVPLIKEKEFTEPLETIVNSILIRDSMETKFELEPNDHVFIRTNPDFIPIKTVTITGEVARPGKYALLKHNETLSEIITRAGGLLLSAYPGGGKLYRDNKLVFVDFENLLVHKSKKDDIILLPGDIIQVPSRPNTVMVTGEVINPGFYKYKPGTKAKELLKNAGGKTENGDKVYVTYPSGQTNRVTFFRNPTMRDGTIITVMAKKPEEEKEKIDWSQTIKDTFALMSSAMMIIYLSQQVK